MRNVLPILIVMTMTPVTLNAQEENNDFYDNAETYALRGKTILQVGGEVGEPGQIDITTLPLRSVIVKEAVMSGDSNRFTGAYRYDGYSLYDILNGFASQKKNAAKFPPIIDLYIVVENGSGEKVTFSWGEIYYPVHRHEIIIATRVARIVPTKTNELWPLPEEFRLVAGHDLLTERNISGPVRITVHSANRSFEVTRDLSPLYAPEVLLFDGNSPLGELTDFPEGSSSLTYESVFYGRGRGIHSTTPFTGVPVKVLLSGIFPMTAELLRNGFLVVSGADGYRAVFTCSEIFNRNDQAEILLIREEEGRDGGAFRLFPAPDFFSDRAVKAVNGIYLERPLN